MNLSWSDLRRTVRRQGGGPAQAYPFVLRDERLHPRLGMAIQYFESMLGRPRAELDSEVLVQLLGDHRLARGVVASLAGHYAHRRRTLSDLLDAATIGRLYALGVRAPADLRAALYDDVNARGGFAAGPERAAALGRLGERFALSAESMEALLTVDALDRAPLERRGPLPTAAEIAATYNHLVVDAVVRSATRVQLRLARRADGLRASLAARAARLGITLQADGDDLALLGEQDSVGSWTRHGRRLVRVLGPSLARHPGKVRGGTAHVGARGGPYACRLDATLLEALAGPADSPAGAGPAVEAAWDARGAIAALRRRGEAKGWSIRHWPGPLVNPDGILFPECVMLREGRSVYVVLADTAAVAATVERLAARLVQRGDCALLAATPLASALEPLGLPLASLAEDEPLATLLATVDAQPPPAHPLPADALVAAVVDATRASGFLPLDKALVLAAPVDAPTLQSRLAAAGTDDVTLVPGVGLYTPSFLAALQDAARGGDRA